MKGYDLDSKRIRSILIKIEDKLHVQRNDWHTAPEVCVDSEFPNSSSSWWYPWAYPTYTVGRGTMTATRESPFFLIEKKNDWHTAPHYFLNYFWGEVLIVLIIWEVGIGWSINYFDPLGSVFSWKIGYSKSNFSTTWGC